MSSQQLADAGAPRVVDSLIDEVERLCVTALSMDTLEEVECFLDSLDPVLRLHIGNTIQFIRDRRLERTACLPLAPVSFGASLSVGISKGSSGASTPQLPSKQSETFKQPVRATSARRAQHNTQMAQRLLTPKRPGTSSKKGRLEHQKAGRPLVKRQDGSRQTT